MESLMREWGLDPDDYDINYEAPPDLPDRAGAYVYGEDTFYIHPGLLDRDVDTAIGVAAHEVRHAMQDEVYEEYGEPDGTDNPLDRRVREDDAEAFSESVVEDGMDDCDEEDDEESASDKDLRMPPPASPAGDFNVPAPGIAYA